MSVAGRAEAKVRRAADSAPLEAAARFGLVVRGLMYMVVGVISMQVAFGGRGQADKGGAVAQIASHSYGSVALWLLAVGLAGLTLWRLSEALFGAPGSGGHEAASRLKSLGRAVLYGTFFASVLRFLLGDSTQATQNSNSQSQAWTARVMSHSGGRILIGLAGLVGIGIGGYLMYRAAARKFLKHLDLYRAGDRTRTAVTVLGLFGGLARGAVVVAVGVFLLIAAVRFDPTEAEGIDGTLRAFASSPLGPYLLVLVAVGLIAFGAYSMCEARWRRV